MVEMVPVPVRVGVVLFVALVVQLAAVNRIELFGATGDVMVVVAVASGFTLGRERGAVVGFATGLAVDLVLTTPLGLTALVFTGVGYVSGIVATNLLRSSRLAVVALAVVAAPVSVLLWAVVGALFGQSHLLDAPLMRVAAANAMVALATIWVVFPVVRWAVEDPHRRVRHLA